MKREGWGPRAWTLAAVGVWLVVVPAACLLLGGVLVGQRMREAALATEGARSAAELATVQQYLGASATPTAPVDLPATWAAGAVTVTAGPTVTAVPPTPTPTLSSPNTATATRTATAATPTPPVEAEENSVAPATATVEGELVIGYSVAGRPLVVRQFGSGPVVRLIVAGIHGGNEWNTIALADALIEHVQQNPETVPPDVTLYILRSLNPDGEARGTGIQARANDNNVDLNRNWPSHWRADWSRTGCWAHLRLSGGTEAGSEPETQALMQFMLDYEVDAVVSYHSAALGIFAGGQPPDTASLSLAEAVAAVSDYPYPPLDFGCVYSGQLIDWASEHGIAALDIELTNHRDIDFPQNLRILEVFVTWRR